MHETGVNLHEPQTLCFVQTTTKVPFSKVCESNG